MNSENRISEITRRAIFDFLAVERVAWSGRLEEVDFLSRLYNLSVMKSTDRRFPDAGGDIWQHRINNSDWPDDWVFFDPRFDLMHCADEDLLRFLSEMVHPAVRPNSEEVRILVDGLNKELRNDGCELVADGLISGRPVFRPRWCGAPALPAMDAAKATATKLGSDYLNTQIARMQLAIDTDPELAIGTAKEFVETVCKTILAERAVSAVEGEDFPKLVRLACKTLKLLPDDIPENAKAADTIKRLLSNLATISQGLAELRNPYGTGHGKMAKSKGLKARHARLAVGAAATLGSFLFETHEEGRGKE